MNLPIQSEPVRRTMVGQLSAGAIDGNRPHGAGVAFCQNGVDASSLADLLASINRFPPIYPTFGPGLGPIIT